MTAILGIGTAVPGIAVPQNDSLRFASNLAQRAGMNTRFLPKIYAGTRIARRHTVLDADFLKSMLEEPQTVHPFYLATGKEKVGPTTRQRMQLYTQHAGQLAIAAAREALAFAGLEPADIVHLVLISCTGFRAPGSDRELIEGLGLPEDIQRTHIGFMGCHGAINGLRVAHAFVESQRHPVLLVAVELCSIHYHYGDDQSKQVANSLFADGAAAVVLGPGTQAWTIGDTGSRYFRHTENEMSWEIGDHGFEMTLSRKIPSIIALNLPAAIDDWLLSLGRTRAEIASWAIHPGGSAIVQAVASCLQLTEMQVAMTWEILSQFGNMSSPTLLFILARMIEQNAPRPCVLLGFGPGIFVETAIID